VIAISELRTHAAPCVIGSWRVFAAAVTGSTRVPASAIASERAEASARRPDVTRHPRLASLGYHRRKWVNSWIERSRGHTPPSHVIYEELCDVTCRKLAKARRLSHLTLDAQVPPMTKDSAEILAVASRLTLDWAARAVLEVLSCTKLTPRPAWSRSRA
jgi:hypothetical protein